MRRRLRLTPALYAAMLCVPFEGTVQAQAESPKPKLIENTIMTTTTIIISRP